MTERRLLQDVRWRLGGTLVLLAGVAQGSQAAELPRAQPVRAPETSIERRDDPAPTAPASEAPLGCCRVEPWQPRLSISLTRPPAARDSAIEPRARFSALDQPEGGVEWVSAQRMSGSGLARQLELGKPLAVRSPVLRGQLSLSANVFRDAAGLGDISEARLLSPRFVVSSADTASVLDVDYTEAHYALAAPGVPSVRLRQFAPALGFALTGPEDWMTLRLYDVRSPDVSRPGGVALRTRAVEAKWVRQIKPQAGAPDELQVSSLFGSRLHAVDPDGASIFSLADMQTGGVSLGASWKLTPNTKWMVSGGYDQFEQGGPGGEAYSNAYLFTGLKGRW